jgi:hypothetical protein
LALKSAFMAEGLRFLDAQWREPRMRQRAGLPFSSAATVRVVSAFRHDATRRASTDVTRVLTLSWATKANSMSSPSARTISLISASDSSPPA